MSAPSARSILRKLRGVIQQSRGIWPDPARNVGASEFEVDLWILSRFLLKKIVPVVGTHPYPLNELLLMTAAACRLRPSVVFDWGTHIGASARVFYECDKELGAGFIRERLSPMLPKYMLPTVFKWTEQMPRNPNGKIDRQKLVAAVN